MKQRMVKMTMTHDELLALLNAKSDSDQVHALRAVVELHKPVMKWTGAYDYNEAELWAEQCDQCSGNGFTQEYPCPTIEAIEKELE